MQSHFATTFSVSNIPVAVNALFFTVGGIIVSPRFYAVFLIDQDFLFIGLTTALS